MNLLIIQIQVFSDIYLNWFSTKIVNKWLEKEGLWFNEKDKH
jgi:hypothetical protein